MEAKARSDYVILKSAINSNFTVEDTGITLCAEHSFLGASSDGKVHDGESIGLLEIKCPYSIQGTRVTMKEDGEIMAMGYSNFCLEESMEGPRLKKATNFMLKFKGRWQLRHYHGVTSKFGPMWHKTIFVLTEFILIQSLCPL